MVQVCFTGGSLIAPLQTECFPPEEVHTTALEFHELPGNKHVDRPWTREIDIEERFEASWTPCQDGHARAEIDASSMS
jgi:hypothetical protein